MYMYMYMCVYIYIYIYIYMEAMLLGVGSLCVAQPLENLSQIFICVSIIRCLPIIIYNTYYIYIIIHT